MGYKDDTKEKKTIMRQLEDKFIHLFHVKQKKHV
jgi:ssRNA-specific RNase YbeY (16S rRNA maturation enzyme)